MTYSIPIRFLFIGVLAVLGLAQLPVSTEAFGLNSRMAAFVIKANEFKTKVDNGVYPPESCSCACCVVQPNASCGMPGPQHWKHHSCTYGLCGNAAVLSKNGPVYAQKEKASFCELNCASFGRKQGESCGCKAGAKVDNWSCPHGGVAEL